MSRDTMDTTETPSQARLLRSKRTRNTSQNDDSIKLPATKKRRSALQRDTFEPLTEATLNEKTASGRGHSRHSSHEQSRLSKTNTTPAADAAETAPDLATTTTTQKTIHELTLRGIKKTEKRSERGVGVLTLATNAQYTISQLPALPDQIRSRPDVTYSCVISPDNEYILALTHTDALVWSYNANTTTPTARDLFTFKLPFPPAITEDPLPLASFTAKAANGEPGIVVISPKWGKVVYWETLSTATSYTPTQSANGVQGSIPGMFHGEIVKELVAAEPAGFILALASGRVAHLTVRDQMGRPAVGIQFMRKSIVGNTRAGIFGSIRNALVGDRRKGQPLVRPGSIARAQRQIVVATADAEFELWTNNLLTGNHLNDVLDLKYDILAGLEASLALPEPLHSMQFKLVDFALGAIASSTELIRPDDTGSVHLVLLVALTAQHKSSYYLVDATANKEGAQIRVVQPIRCYSDDISEMQGFQPRLCIPPSSTTAFILFPRALVVASLAKIAESPSSQLLGEKGSLPEPFQDCIRLKSEQPLGIINFAAEDHDGSPSCVIAIQGFGIARIVSHLPHALEIEPEHVISKVDARSRIEEAIFFGTRQNNPFDLRRSYRDSYEASDLRQAVLNIDRSIVLSTSPHIAKSSSSIADHLQLRARALADLIQYATRVYPDCLTPADRFIMLWNAEKVAAAQAIWKVQENIQATYPRKDEREMSYMNLVLLMLSEKHQHFPTPEKGETDHVRHWLTHSTIAVEHFLVELEEGMKELAGIHLSDPQVICDYFLEGIELWTAAIRAGFGFREDNASIYGLGNEAFKDGVLLSGYPQGVPPPWTSKDNQVPASQAYIRAASRFLADWWEYSEQPSNGSSTQKQKKSKQHPINTDTGEPYAAPSRESLETLANMLPEQVELSSRIATEANVQQLSQIHRSSLDEDEKSHQIEVLQHQLTDITRASIREIAPYNRDGAIKLAESRKDTHLLVILNLEFLADLSRRLKSHPEEEDDIMLRIRAVQDHVETYFDRFGNDWAYSHFSSMIDRGELGRLIGEGQIDGGKKQPYLTWFFETCAKHDKRVGKLSWINDIIGQNKFDVACKTLETVASVEEGDVWSKKTEICLAKLAGLAALENSNTSFTSGTVKAFDTELEYIQVVETLALHINANLYDTIDDEAAVQLAIDLYIPKSMSNNKKYQQQRKTLTETLYKLVTNQIVPVSDLVDALTLLQLDQLSPELEFDDISGTEFPLALRAIDIAPSSDADNLQKQSLRKTVWRRLLIRDDWSRLNQTAGKSDGQVKDEMQQTILFMTLLDLNKQADENRADVTIPSIDDIMDTKDDKPTDDVKDELSRLKKFVDKARLKDHFGGLIKEAKDELRRFKDQVGDAQADDVFGPEQGQVNGASSRA